MRKIAERWNNQTRKYLYSLLILFIITGCPVIAQDLGPKSLPTDTLHLRVIFAGDMMGHLPLVNSCLTDDGSYDYTPIFENIRNYISTADIAVANLEVPLAGPPYAGYPQFSSPDALASGLQQVGFNVFVTANNHALDRGKQGFDRTIDALDSLHFWHTGTFKDSADKQKHNPLFIDKNNIRLAIINYTYGTNGFKPQNPDLINYIDSSDIRKDIEACHRQKADFIVVVFHWGNEYERYPSVNQRQLVEYIRLLGADAIIGSHPHVIQPVERFGNLHNSQGIFPVVYSLGNFVSNQRDRYKDGGIIFELNLVKYNTTWLQSSSYLPLWVYKGILNGKMAYRLVPLQKLSELEVKYNLSEQDKTKAAQFFTDTQEHLNNVTLMDKAILKK